MLKEFESIAQKIQADFERTKDLPHQGVKGVAREQSVTEDFLKQYLPPKYSIGSGLITDANGDFSRQQDIVIYDGFNLPVLQDLQDNKVFFAEQVLAAIEVKSSLAHAEITDIIDKARSIGSLRRTGAYQLYTASQKFVGNESQIFAFGFAYESRMSLSQMRDYVQKKVNESESHWNVSSLIVLTDADGASGLITNLDAQEVNRLKISPPLDSPIASVKSESQGEALFTFYLQLMQALQIAEASALAPDYLAYARTAGLGTIDVEVGKIGMQNTPFLNAVEILRKAHLVPEEQVLDAYYYLMKQGESFVPGGSHYDRSTVFTIGKEIFVEDPRPFEVWESLNRYKTGTSTAQDRRRLAQLVKMLRIVSTQNTFLSVVSPKPADRD